MITCCNGILNNSSKGISRTRIRNQPAVGWRRVNTTLLHLQLSRWKKAGKIIQLLRGLYAPAPAYQKNKRHPFLIANRLQPASCISMQSALSHYGLIPDYVMVTTSFTTVRPRNWKTRACVSSGVDDSRCYSRFLQQWVGISARAGEGTGACSLEPSHPE